MFGQPEALNYWNGNQFVIPQPAAAYPEQQQEVPAILQQQMQPVLPQVQGIMDSGGNDRERQPFGSAIDRAREQEIAASAAEGRGQDNWTRQDQGIFGGGLTGALGGVPGDLMTAGRYGLGLLTGGVPGVAMVGVSDALTSLFGNDQEPALSMAAPSSQGIHAAEAAAQQAAAQQAAQRAVNDRMRQESESGYGMGGRGRDTIGGGTRGYAGGGRGGYGSPF